MRELLEGSQAVARTVAHCRPQVVPAYPITPQTHIVEGLGALIREGTLTDCRFITVESEFAALSAAIGAAAAGSRAYTATASQGLLYMAEVLFNVSGLGLPIVMTVANRAIGSPINIWNDHSDSMSQRDSGWMQLYAEDNQAAVDLHVIAFMLAEALSVPVMVCVDGFVLTHAFEPIEVPDQQTVDALLPAYAPRQRLDPDEPVTIGAMVGPEAFTEVRYLAHRQHQHALSVLQQIADRYQALTGRRRPSITRYGSSTGTVVVALGSVTGTVQAAVDEVAADGVQAGLVAVTMFRPFPARDLAAALAEAERVVVVERSLAPGGVGPVTAEVQAALRRHEIPIHTVVAGLGGRPVFRASVVSLLRRAAAGTLAEFSVLDLRREAGRGTGEPPDRAGDP